MALWRSGRLRSLSRHTVSLPSPCGVMQYGAFAIQGPPWLFLPICITFPLPGVIHTGNGHDLDGSPVTTTRIGGIFRPHPRLRSLPRLGMMKATEVGRIEPAQHV